MMHLTKIFNLTAAKAKWCLPLIILAGMMTSYAPAAAQCNASFTFNVLNDSTVDFTNTSTYSGSQVYWFWSFGNGNSSNLENPSNHYSQPGQYGVNLQLIDSLNGCFDSYWDTIWVGSKNCYADFSYSINGSQVNFYNSSVTTTGSLSYEWIFGDGSSNSTAEHPVHNYNTSGTFDVILLAHRSGCADTIVKQIQIQASSCQADFHYSVNGAQVKFYDTSVYSGHVIHTWDFGDGDTSAQVNPTHTYSANGTYEVCLIIWNSSTNCWSQFCDSVTVSLPTCNADFSYAPAGANYIKFTNLSTPTNGNMHWNFGDGHTSTQHSPQHYYSIAPDTMAYVTLIVSSSHCADTIAKWINLPPPQYFIQGMIYKGLQGNNIASSLTAYLIEHDSSAGTLTFVDSMNGDSMYAFEVTPGNRYLVKAALTSADPDYTDFLPTYYDSVLFWNNAIEINVVASQTIYNHSFRLLSGTNPGGPGFVGGLISQGANKKGGPGDPLEGVQVMLLNMDDSPVAYTYSGADGKFAFDDIPLGQFQVYSEVIGKTTVPLVVDLTNDNPEVEDLEIEVGTTTVTGIFDKANVSLPLALEIFPNPANGLVNILHNSKESGDVTIRVMNHLGQEVMRTNEQAAAGQKNLWKLNLDEMPAGLYLVEVMKTTNSNTAVNVSKLMIK
ncbi:MAG: PKD domain-containing protein [Bacteroidia bacterium]